MPELLVPMGDLRYAALMFGKGCNLYVCFLSSSCSKRDLTDVSNRIDSCGKTNAGKVDPSFRARVCTKCIKDVYVQSFEGVFTDDANLS